MSATFLVRATFLLILLCVQPTSTQSPKQQPPPQPPPDTCWTSESGGNGHWYRIVVSTTPISWSSARYRANVSGGTLAVLNTPEEAAFVSGLADKATDAWAGPRARRIGPWIGAFRASDDPNPATGWLWVGGSEVGAPRWAAGQPSPRTANYAALIGAEKWTALPAKGAPVTSYIVEFNRKPRDPDPHEQEWFAKSPRTVITKTDWGNGPRWYKAFRTDNPISWSDAKAAAAAAGGQIAAIHSAPENRLIADLIAGMLWDWTDDPKSDPLAWVGASRPKSAPWTWADSQPWKNEASHWANGQPAKGPAQDSALAIHPRGVWFEETQKTTRVHAYVVVFDHDPDSQNASPAPAAAAAKPDPDDTSPLGMMNAYFALCKSGKAGEARARYWGFDDILKRMFRDDLPKPGPDLDAMRARLIAAHTTGPDVELQAESEALDTYQDVAAEPQPDGSVRVRYAAVNEVGHKTPTSALVKNIDGHWRIIDEIDRGDTWWFDSLYDRYKKSGNTPRRFIETLWKQK